MRTAVIVDVDGTLVDVSSIRHLVTGETRNFDKFHQSSIDCPPVTSTIEHVLAHKEAGHAILVVTARKAKFRNVTAMWLALHGVPSDRLYMRGDKDNRADNLVKSDILDQIVTEFEVVHAIDDNPNVIALWESHGIPVTIVEGWGF